jgi:hypothetical protein
LDTSWEARPSGIQTLPSYSGDLHLPQRLEGGGPPGTCTNGLRVQEWPASESAGVARTERVRHPDPRRAAREDDVGFGGPVERSGRAYPRGRSEQPRAVPVRVPGVGCWG